MLKRNITYEDFDGNKVTEVFYFNLSKSEWLEMEFGRTGGFGEAMRRIINAEDNKSLIAEFKALILKSYGQRSEDGKRFIKTDQIREEFSQTAAYDTLFMELATNDAAAATFIKGILPKDMGIEFDKAVETTPEAMIRTAQESIVKAAQDAVPKTPSIVEARLTEAAGTSFNPPSVSQDK